MKTRRAIVWILLVMMCFSLPLAQAESTEFTESIKEWQKYFEDTFALDEDYEYDFKWRYNGSPSVGEDYLLDVSSEDWTYTVGFTFSNDDIGGVVSSIYMSCFMYDKSWTDAALKSIIKNIVLTGLTALNEYETFEELQEDVYSIYECLGGYSDGSSPDATKRIDCMYGDFNVQFYDTNSNGEPDYLMFAIYAY